MTPSSQANLPKYLPEECEACGHEFSRVVRPARRFQKKAQLLLAAGIVLSILWGGFLVGSLLLAGIVFRPGIISGVIGLAIIVLPGIILGFFAAEMPKVVVMHCKRCNWQKKYLVARSGQVLRED